MSHCKLYFLTFINIYNNTSHFLSSISLVTFFHLILLYTHFSYASYFSNLDATYRFVNVLSYFTRTHFLFKHCFPSVHALAFYWYVNSILLAYSLRTFPSLLYPLKRPFCKS